MARSTELRHRDDISTSAAEAVLNGTVTAPADYQGVFGGDMGQFPGVEYDGMFCPYYIHESADREDVLEMAFADAYSDDVETGSVPESAEDARGGAVYFHTAWLTRYEAANLVRHLPEMPRFNFDPERVADEIDYLPSNSLVAVGREKFGETSVPVIYVWTGSPGYTHKFCHATDESGSLFFDAGDQYPLVGESGPVESDHVLDVRRGKTKVCRVAFSELD